MSEQITAPQSFDDQELSEDELEDVAGGATVNNGCNIGCTVNP